MRKWMLMIMAVALVLSMASVAEAGLPFKATLSEPGEGDMTEEEAVEIARPIWLAETGTMDDWDKYIEYATTFLQMEVDGEMRPVWAARLHDRNGEYPFCLVMLDAKTGDVYRTETLTGEAISRLSSTGDNLVILWPLAEQEIFFHLWHKTVSYCNMHNGQPGAEHISQAEAEEIAEAMILEHCDITPERLAKLRQALEFYVGVEEDGVETKPRDNWVILYIGVLPSQDGYFRSEYQVTVDAITGEVMLAVEGNSVYYPTGQGGEGVG